MEVYIYCNLWNVLNFAYCEYLQYYVQYTFYYLIKSNFICICFLFLRIF